MKISNVEGAWISFILRVAVVSLFAATAIGKAAGGYEGFSLSSQEIFPGAWLPGSAVIMYSKAVPYVEMVVPVWLILGFRLRLAWVAASMHFILLAFGMLGVEKHAIASQNYLYVLICAFGIYFSQFDRASIDALSEEEE